MQQSAGVGAALRKPIAHIAGAPGEKQAFGAIEKLASWGCRLIELPFGSPEYFPEFDIPSVIRLIKHLEQLDVKVQSVHLNFSSGCDIGDPDPAVRRAVVNSQKQGLLLAGELGANVAIQHPSLHWGDDDRRLRIDIAADSVAELASFASSCGVRLAVENMLGTIIGCQEDELLGIISRADPDWCGICFDSGHANLHGRFEDIASALLPRTITTHLHDNDGKDDLHQFPGMGIINWGRLGEIFNDSQCQALLTVESSQFVHSNWQDAQKDLLSLLFPNQKQD